MIARTILSLAIFLFDWTASQALADDDANAAQVRAKQFHIKQIARIDIETNSPGGAAVGIADDFWIGNQDGKIFNFVLDGSLKFAGQLDGAIGMKPVVIHEGNHKVTIIIGTSTGHLYAISPDYKIQLIAEITNDGFQYSPFLFSDNSIVAVSVLGRVMKFNSDFKLLSNINIAPDSDLRVIKSSSLMPDNAVAIPVSETHGVGKTVLSYRIYIVRDNSIKFWDLKDNASCSVMALPNGLAAYGTADGFLHVVRISSGKDVEYSPISFEKADSAGVSLGSWGVCQTGIVLSNGYLVVPLFDGRICYLNCADGSKGPEVSGAPASATLGIMNDPTLLGATSTHQLVVKSELSEKVVYLSDQGVPQGSCPLRVGRASAPIAIGDKTIVSDLSRSVYILQVCPVSR